MSINKQTAPQTVDDLVIENPNTRARIEDYASGLRTGHMLMHGPKGTGKSSTAEVIVKSRVDPEQYAMAKPYEGSKMTSSDLDLVIQDWNWQRIGCDFPVTVINEVDLLSPAALERLKSLMDEKSHLGQIIATTNHMHKLSAPLRDRFDIIEMPAISPEAFQSPIRQMLQAHGVAVHETQLHEMLATTNGSWRSALSVGEDLKIASQKRSASSIP